MSDDLSLWSLPGEVGDWQNHLSAEDIAVLDQVMAEGLKDLTQFTIQYTPTADAGKALL